MFTITKKKYISFYSVSQQHCKLGFSYRYVICYAFLSTAQQGRYYVWYRPCVHLSAGTLLFNILTLIFDMRVDLV